MSNPALKDLSVIAAVFVVCALVTAAMVWSKSDWEARDKTLCERAGWTQFQTLGQRYCIPGADHG